MADMTQALTYGGHDVGLRRREADSVEDRAHFLLRHRASQERPAYDVIKKT